MVIVTEKSEVMGLNKYLNSVPNNPYGGSHGLPSLVQLIKLQAIQFMHTDDSEISTQQ